MPQPNIKNIIYNLQQEFRPNRLLPNLSTGLILGILNIPLLISFAALIFSGELSSYLPSGIGFILLGFFVICSVMAFTSSCRGVIAGPQDIPAAVIALMAASITSNMSATITEEAFLTVITVIIITSFATGIFFLTMGLFKLGNLIRFIPYPVIGGFLAGTGWLLIKGAISFSTDISLSLPGVPLLVQTAVLIKWLPGLVFAVILLIVLRRYSHFLIMPIMLVSAIGVFYLVLLLTNTSVAEAGAQGWLLGPLPKEALFRPITLSVFTNANWALVFKQIGNIGAIMLISIISLLLNASGIELAFKQDIDLNRELKSAGIANLFAVFAGCPVGYHMMSDTALGHSMGGNSRLVSLFAALLCGAALFFGAAILSFFPKPVLAGLLFFLGLGFMVEWLYDTWFKLPKTDYFLIFLILFVVGTFGFLQGVGVGIIVAVVLFVVNYSHINVVKYTLSGVNYQSNVDRLAQHIKLLKERGNQIYILKLQGFIFFGTANRLFCQVRDRANNPNLPLLRFIVLDFRLVTGLDSSALNSFIKMKQLAEKENIKLVFTHLSPEFRQLFEKGGFSEKEDKVSKIFDDLDYGVEYSENQILSAENVSLADKGKPLQEQLKEIFPESVDIAKLIKYFVRQEVEEGHYLMRQGDAPEGLYFIESGQVTAVLEHKGGETVRLRKMAMGTVVGELGLYLGSRASASVVTNKPSTLYHLSIENLNKMEATDPELASAFHKFIARLLGNRLANTDKSLQALLV